MKHAREDYNNIQQCDKPELRELFGQLLHILEKEGLCSEEALGFARSRFEAAIAETIPAEEPVFLLRGQDVVGHITVRSWAHIHRVNGGPDGPYLLAMQHANLMEAWPVKKAADLPTSDVKKDT